MIVEVDRCNDLEGILRLGVVLPRARLRAAASPDRPGLRGVGASSSRGRRGSRTTELIWAGSARLGDDAQPRSTSSGRWSEMVDAGAVTARTGGSWRRA